MENKSANGGIGFIGLLAIVFIVLKLCHIIDWSWVLVLSPLIIEVIIITICIIILVALGGKK